MVLDKITSVINQLPSKDEKGISQRKEYFDLKEKESFPRHVKPEKRKGPLHSEERIFNHPRE